MLNKSRYLLLIMSLIFIVIPSVSYAAEDVIKVGFTQVKGFSEIKDGECSGYTYEYLREIARYTGWQYEFVEIDSSEILSMLKSNEVDLIGGILKNEASEALFDFPEYDCGATYTTIATLKSNTQISESNYETLEGIRVGVFETATSRIKKFEEFCEAHDIENIEVVKYNLTSDDILHEALKNGEVDAILAGDLLVNSDERIVAKFAATPYYFATNKGNTDIIKDLNYAIGKIREIDSHFNMALYNKYFSEKEVYKLVFSEEEKAFINELKHLRAVYIDNYAPIQNYSRRNKKVEGVAIDIVHILAEYLNAEIELIKAGSYKEALEIMRNQGADIILTMPSEYEKADKYSIALTKTYLCLPLVRVENKLSIDKENKVLVLPKGEHSSINISTDNVIYKDNLAKCIEAINRGEADYTYGDIYSVESYTREHYYNNISIIYTNELLTELCIGVARTADVTLLSIINKVVQSISKEQMEEIIYQNVIYSKGERSIATFIYSNYRFLIVVMGCISILIFLIMRLKLKYTRDINKMFKERAEKDALTGVYNSGLCETLINDYMFNKPEGMYGAFLIMDIDHFKSINDNLGHKIGDDVLRELATSLMQLFGNNNIVARWGGDEFIVFMKDLQSTELDTVRRKATQLCQMMDKDIESNGKMQHISLSVGSIVIKQHKNFLDIYQLADKNLYKVKENGKNGFEIEIVE